MLQESRRRGWRGQRQAAICACWAACRTATCWATTSWGGDRLPRGEPLPGGHPLPGSLLACRLQPGGFPPGGHLLPLGFLTSGFQRGSPLRDRELRAQVLDLGIDLGQLALEHRRVIGRRALGRPSTPGRRPLRGRPLGRRALGGRVPGDRTLTRRAAGRRTLGRGFPRRAPLGRGLRVLFRNGATGLRPAGGLAAPGGLPFDVLPGVHRRDDLPPPAQLVVGSRTVGDVRNHRQGGFRRRVDGVGARVDPRHLLEDVEVHVAAPATDRAVAAHPAGSRGARRVGEVHGARRPAVPGELEHEAATRRGAVVDVATCEGLARRCGAAHAEIVAE